MLTAVVGVNWGDEGKGRMVDLLCADYDIVTRYQGGNNAGHTVVAPQGKFILNLLPSGILHSGTVNVMGPGMAVDPEHLTGELTRLRSRGVEISPQNLKISHLAVLCLPFHRLLDNLEEDRLGDRQYGSTRRGIAPVYGDKYMKKALRMEDLLDPGSLGEKVAALVEWKNLTVEKGYGHAPVSAQETLSWLETYALPLREYVCDAGAYLDRAAEEGPSILFEAQLGALRDIDFGIYPYTSSSSTIAAYAPIGAGIPARRLDRVIGIMKAYSSCVGEGPFVCEFFGPEAEALRESGGEYGAATGRPRRVGAFDVVASRYGVRIQGATELALTKLDVLSGMERIPVCTGYELDGQVTQDFPSAWRQRSARPVYEYLEGFSGDISRCRTMAELPEAARQYVLWIQQAVDCPIRWVSVGAGRDECIRL